MVAAILPMPPRRHIMPVTRERARTRFDVHYMLASPTTCLWSAASGPRNLSYRHTGYLAKRELQLPSWPPILDSASSDESRHGTSNLYRLEAKPLPRPPRITPNLANNYIETRPDPAEADPTRIVLSRQGDVEEERSLTLHPRCTPNPQLQCTCIP